MTTSTRSFTLRDYPDLKLAVASNSDEEPIALAIEVKGDWLVRDFRHGRALDIYGYDEAGAREVLDRIAGVGR